MTTGTFDPDAWLADKERQNTAPQPFDPDAYLAGSGRPDRPGIAATVADDAKRLARGTGDSGGMVIEGTGTGLEIVGNRAGPQSDTGLVSLAVGTLLKDGGRWVRDAVRDAYNTDERRDNKLTAKVAEGLGSLPPAIAAGPFAPFAVGAMMGQSGADDAAASMARRGITDPEEIAAAQEIAYLLNAPVGAVSEALLGVPAMLKSVGGMGGITSILEKLTPAARSAAGRLLRQLGLGAAREGTQEGTEQLAQNVIARDLAGYDPDRKRTEGVGEAAMLGALIGGPVSASFQGAQELDARAGHREFAAQLDTDQNIPESRKTLLLQQDQVRRGLRPAQMFPAGSESLPLADGLAEHRNDRGVFHYNPEVITPAEIDRLSAEGRENVILGLGSVSKPEALARAEQTGEPVVSVTERAADGTEIKTAVGTTGTADAQRAELEAGKSPGSTVQVEPVQAPLVDRLLAQDAARMQERQADEAREQAERDQRNAELTARRQRFDETLAAARTLAADPRADYSAINGAVTSLRQFAEDNALGLTTDQRNAALSTAKSLEPRAARLKIEFDAQREAEASARRAQAEQAEQAKRRRIAAENARLDAIEATGRDPQTGRVVDLQNVPDDELTRIDPEAEGLSLDDIAAEFARRERSEAEAGARGDADYTLRQLFSGRAANLRGAGLSRALRLPTPDAERARGGLAGELAQLQQDGVPFAAFSKDAPSLDRVAETLRGLGFRVQTEADVVDLVRRAYAGEDVRPSFDTEADFAAARRAEPITHSITTAQLEAELPVVQLPPANIWNRPNRENRTAITDALAPHKGQSIVNEATGRALLVTQSTINHAARSGGPDAFRAWSMLPDLLRHAQPVGTLESDNLARSSVEGVRRYVSAATDGADTFPVRITTRSVPQGEQVQELHMLRNEKRLPGNLQVSVKTDDTASRQPRLKVRDLLPGVKPTGDGLNTADFATAAKPAAPRYLTDAEAAAEWASIRRALPEIARDIDLQMDLVADSLEREGYANEAALVRSGRIGGIEAVTAPIRETLRQTRAQKRFVVVAAQAARQGKAPGLLLHELAHPFYDSLPDQTKRVLAEMHRRETTARTGPLFDADGRLLTNIAIRAADFPRARLAAKPDLPVQEWFAERMRILNVDWLQDRAARGEAPLLVRLWRDLLDRLKQIFARTRGLRVDSDLFTDTFRTWLSTGLEANVAGEAVAYAARQGAQFAQQSTLDMGDIALGLDLPDTIKNLRPRWQDKTLNFQSTLDKALYYAAGEGNTATREAVADFITRETGLSRGQIQSLARSLREKLAPLARNVASDGTLRLPPQMQGEVEKLTGVSFAQKRVANRPDPATLTEQDLIPDETIRALEREAAEAFGYQTFTERLSSREKSRQNRESRLLRKPDESQRTLEEIGDLIQRGIFDRDLAIDAISRFLLRLSTPPRNRYSYTQGSQRETTVGRQIGAMEETGIQSADQVRELLAEIRRFNDGKTYRHAKNDSLNIGLDQYALRQNLMSTGENDTTPAVRLHRGKPFVDPAVSFAQAQPGPPDGGAPFMDAEQIPEASDSALRAEHERIARLLAGKSRKVNRELRDQLFSLQRQLRAEADRRGLPALDTRAAAAVPDLKTGADLEREQDTARKEAADLRHPAAQGDVAPGDAWASAPKLTDEQLTAEAQAISQFLNDNFASLAGIERANLNARLDAVKAEQARRADAAKPAAEEKPKPAKELVRTLAPQIDRQTALVQEWRRGQQLMREGDRTGNDAAAEEGARVMAQAKARLDLEFPDWQAALYQDKPATAAPRPAAPRPAAPATETRPDVLEQDDGRNLPPDAPYEPTADETVQPPTPENDAEAYPVRKNKLAGIYGHTSATPTFLARTWERARDTLQTFRGAIPELPTFPFTRRAQAADPVLRAKGPDFYNRLKEGVRTLNSGNDYLQKTAEEDVASIVQPLLKIGGKFDAGDYRRLQRRQEQRRRLIAERKPVPAGVAAEIRALESKLESHPYVLFNRLVYMMDLRWRQTNLQDSQGNPIAVPDGLNPAEVQAELARLSSRIEASPHKAAIEAAFERHTKLVADVAADLQRRDLLATDALKNPYYFPHLTLQITKGDQTTERELRPQKVRPGTEADFRGYLVDPVGSRKPVEQDYVRAMYYHLVQVGAHNFKADVVRDFFRAYDLRSQLEERARELSRERGHTVGWEQVFHEEYAPAGYVLYGTDSRDAFPTLEIDRDKLARRLGVVLTAGDLNEQLEKLGVRGIKLLPDDIRETMQMGARETWVVPAGVADALRGIADRQTPRADQPIETALKAAVGWWKAWKLFMPWNHLRYEYGNLVADLEKVFSTDPRTFTAFRDSARELRALWTGEGEINDDLRAALREGVINAITAQEMNQLARVRAFEQFETAAEKIAKQVRKRASSAITQPIANLFGMGDLSSVELSAFREAVFRYSKFKTDLDRIRNGARPVYAGAFWRDIEAIQDSRPGAGDRAVRQAAQISKATFGDYGDLTVGGQWLREKLIPFYSWMEVNFKYHANLLRNLKDLERAGQIDPKDAAAQRARAIGTAAASMTTRAAGAFALRLALPYAALALWNAFGPHDVEDDDLSEADRRRVHLRLGKTEDGKALVIYGNTALADVMKWFGGPKLMQAGMDWLNGRTDFLTAADKWASELPGDVLNEAVGSVGPVAKIPYTLASGKTTFPDVFDGRTVPAYDMRRYIISQMTDDFLADQIEKAVNKDYYAPKDTGDWAAQLVLQVRQRDPEQWAFYGIKDKAAEFVTERTGRKREGGSYDAPDQQVLRNFRRAIYRGDLESATKFYTSLLDYGYTAERFAASIRSQEPLHDVPKELRREFVAGLGDAEREQLRRAYLYYERMRAGEGRERQLFPRKAWGAMGQANYQTQPRTQALESIMRAGQADDETLLRRADQALREALNVR